MSRHCEDCGTVLNGGICSNCSEELYIVTYQSDGLDGVPLSEEFMSKVDEQAERLRSSAKEEKNG